VTKRNSIDAIYRNIVRVPGPIILAEFGVDVASAPCWIWQGQLDKDGYGVVSFKGETHRAHVFFYKKKIGPILPGLEIDHRCKVRACVQPLHLEAVTRQENMARAGLFKLTDHDVETIREMYQLNPHLTHEYIAGVFGVSRTLITRILNRNLR